MTGRLVRVRQPEGPRLRFRLDGRAVEAAVGDSLLTAILLNGRVLRRAEFGGGHRAGFCLMGACQDCYVQLDDGRRLRACQTPLEAGMSVRTDADGWPDAYGWPDA